jgi:apolipoprotein D and lipocalin family protein
VTAEYSLRDDGLIRVVNSCRKGSLDGPLKRSTGRAKVVDQATNAKLKVSFFGPFWGDYWIVDLAPDYRYVVIATPSRRFGWVLSRTPAMADTDLQRAYAVLREQGYDTGEFRKTLQQSP